MSRRHNSVLIDDVEGEPPTFTPELKKKLLKRLEQVFADPLGKVEIRTTFFIPKPRPETHV